MSSTPPSRNNTQRSRGGRSSNNDWLSGLNLAPNYINGVAFDPIDNTGPGGNGDLITGNFFSGQVTIGDTDDGNPRANMSATRARTPQTRETQSSEGAPYYRGGVITTLQIGDNFTAVPEQQAHVHQPAEYTAPESPSDSYSSRSSGSRDRSSRQSRRETISTANRNTDEAFRHVLEIAASVSPVTRCMHAEGARRYETLLESLDQLKEYHDEEREAWTKLEYLSDDGSGENSVADDGELSAWEEVDAEDE
ncbi:hypothetical protein I350_00921 [Cryptococcus amylolentus CBS 6273]|uniref:Uncharacterized protein n=1 Tax=Cryptococcus amylolentus CBS 6273 TaxID=1296118 RepID=A0A1E3KGJ6_9TREE|nr:hypothetical protein I350_00921 [Cryptococcus amylolentus CBS 6273]